MTNLDKKWKVTVDHHGSNQDVSLYTKTYPVHAPNEKEAISNIKSLVGGRNHKAILAEHIILSFKEYLAEAATVDTESYKRSHGKQPNGRGSWIFIKHGIQNSLDFSKHEEGKDWFQHNGTYAEAKSKAKNWAKTQGYSYIHTAP